MSDFLTRPKAALNELEAKGLAAEQEAESAIRAMPRWKQALLAACAVAAAALLVWGLWLI